MEGRIRHRRAGSGRCPTPFPPAVDTACEGDHRVLDTRPESPDTLRATSPRARECKRATEYLLGALWLFQTQIFGLVVDLVGCARPP